MGCLDVSWGLVFRIGEVRLKDSLINIKKVVAP